MGIRFRSIRTAALLVGACAACMLAAGLLTAGCTGANNGERSTSTGGNEGFVTAVEGSADQQEIRLYYRILGSGADTLVLVHGGPGAGMNTILPDTRGLGDHLTLLYYDQRGGGHSSLPADTALLEARHFAEDLEAVRAHFGLKEMHVLTHSFGALVLAEYAERHPDRLRRIVLHGPTAPSREIAARRYRSRGGNEGPQPDSSLLQRYQAVLTSLLEGTAEEPREACRTYERLGKQIAEVRGDTTARWRGTECRAPAEAVRYYFHRTAQLTPRSFGPWDYTRALGAVDAPALIVHGALDSLGLAGSRAWEDALPRGELFVVPGAHRGAIADRPDLVEPVIASFIQEGRMPRPPPSGLMSPLSANHRPIEP